MKQHVKKCPAFAPTNLKSACECDGYHTFNELYDHRIELFLALCRMRDKYIRNEDFTTGIWRSKKHSNGELAYGGGWFVMGIGYDKGEQITYHLPLTRWDETNFADTLDQAPEFDGYSPDDVLQRLKQLNI